MALEKQLRDLEFTRGLETYPERKRAPQAALLDLENAVFVGGVPTKRSGGEALPNGTSNPDGPLTTALALETAGGELLRWTGRDDFYPAGVWGKSAQANTWVQRGSEDVARPLLASFEQVVSGPVSAEAHDCLSLGDLDVVVWTESAQQGAARVLRACVRERETQRVLQLNTLLATDGTGPGDEVWRLQPRLAQVDEGSLAVFYVIDGEVLCRVLRVANPEVWGAAVTLASDVAYRTGPRYPFELDAVGSSSGAVVVWTGTTQGSATLTASANTGSNPAPALLIDPTCIYTGNVTLTVDTGTTLTVGKQAVADPTATNPAATRTSLAFTGYIDAKVTAAPAFSFARTAGSSGSSNDPVALLSTYSFTGIIDVGLFRDPSAQNATNYSLWANLRFDSPGYINSFGPAGGLVRARVIAREERNVDLDIPRSAIVQVTGPNGYSQTLTMYEPGPVHLGSPLDWHAFPGLGYSFALPTLSPSLSTKNQYWEWRFWPLMAYFVINGGSGFYLRPDGTPYYTHNAGVPIPMSLTDPANGNQPVYIQVTYSGSQPQLYRPTDIWRITAQAGKVAYSRNGGSYGSPVPLYDSIGDGYPHAVAPGITLLWPYEFPTKLTTDDVFRVNVGAGLFHYQLTGGYTGSGLVMYDGNGQPIVHSISDGSGPIAIDVRWPSNTFHTTGESWTYTVTNSARVARAAVGQSSGVPFISAGPYDLNVNQLDGLTLDKHGSSTLDTSLVFRDRTLSQVQAYVFTSSLTAVSGPLVLATAPSSKAAAGLLHVATYLDDNGTVVAILEPTGQYPLEVVAFTQAGVEGAIAIFARQLRLLSRPFLVGDRWCVATLWMPNYGGSGGTAVGLQPTAFILAVDSRFNGESGLVGRLLAGNAAPLLSSGLPKTLATEEGTARFLVPRRTRLQLQTQGESLVDVSVTGLTSVTLSEAEPATISCVEDEGGLHLGGALPRYYDGANFAEDGFALYPEGLSVAFSSGGSLSAGQYSWQVVYQWTDSRGRRHTSAPSVPLTGTATSGQKATLTVPLLHLTEKRDVQLVVYRTEHDGTTHYRTTLLSYVQPDALSQIADTVQLVDGVADSAIVSNEILYTDGGELDHFPPPPYTVAAKHLDYFFTNTMEDTSGFSWSLPARVSEGTAWSDAFASRLGSASGPVSGFATMDEKLIIFTQKAEHVVLGYGPDVTGANSSFSQFPQLVTGSVGCTNPQSIVSTPVGVFHSSAAGLYLLTRTLEDAPAGDSVNRYSGLTVSKALLLETVRQVRFYTREGTTLVFDYSPQVLQWSVFTGQVALDAALFDGVAHYCNGGGVVRESAAALTENGEDFAVKVGSAWLKFSSFQGAQRVWHCLLLGTLGGSVQATATTYYDYEEEPRDTKAKLLPGPNAGGGALLQVRHALSKQVCEAFRFVWTFTPAPQSPGDSGKLVLNGVTLEVGVKPGRAKLNKNQNY